MHIELQSLREGYAELGQHILDKGWETSPRGEKTLEVLGASFTLRDPTDSLPVGTGRGVVKTLAATETLQLIGGFHDPEMLVKAAPHFAAYLDPLTGEQRSPYGPRLYAQLPIAIQRLKEDPDSRQAQVALWRYDEDNILDAHDLPCTSVLQWFVRDDKLQMQVHMRSNDFWLGVPYDVFMFTQLQLAIASVLGVEVGAYRHSAASLHIYEKHWEKVDELTTPTMDALPTYGIQSTDSSWDDVVFRARAIHADQRFLAASTGETWLHLAMAKVHS